MTARVLITGTTGFIGSHVVAAARTVPGLRLRLMTHRTALPASAAPPGAETVYGDLADPATLRGSCEGVDAVIHCASWIGGDEPTARSVNAEGTRALVEEADRCGVTRIVYLSTASVYGRGPFTGLRPGQAEPAPASATSLTRAAAEQHVLAAGGAVVRPHLVYGAGDRWAVPGLVGLLRQLSAVPAGCRARHSMIDVEALGRALLSAALSPKEPAGVYHVNHPEPVRSSQLLSTVVDELRLPWGDTGIDMGAARERLAGVPYALHHLGMLAVDHWFTDERADQDFDWEPGDDFTTAFARHAPWYRRHLGLSP
ncbi:NAD-dependent epimerase/dehydratase family protein [Streptomyces sp. NBC_01618]|uniref:NAD-dependent epimerase/dehydratase family protein n=1 Tax=Streptomyces sp. NBC_01618 TaxID=2975900 RepID=UPI003868EBCE|nr:NAD-dependent epimerase/dehydratase family protein [Streptomyces sp. NBC_01618]